MRIEFCGIGRQRMLGGNCAKGDTHDGVGASRIDPELFIVAIKQVRKSKAHAVAFAYPVALHGFHLLRPAVELVKVGEQLFGVLGDAEEIHRDFTFFNQRAGAPATSVYHLLVGQHGVVHRVPVHSGGFLVDNAFFE